MPRLSEVKEGQAFIYKDEIYTPLECGQFPNLYEGKIGCSQIGRLQGIALYFFSLPRDMRYFDESLEVSLLNGNKLTLHQFNQWCQRVNSKPLHMRSGQFLMTELYRLSIGAYREVTNTEYDAFYDDSKVDRLIEYVRINHVS